MRCTLYSMYIVHCTRTKRAKKDRKTIHHVKATDRIAANLLLRIGVALRPCASCACSSIEENTILQKAYNVHMYISLHNHAVKPKRRPI